jgi:2-polyprenyl-6-methoxyphenol hydroxylase-like FAD-dependent oxidoreductase
MHIETTPTESVPVLIVGGSLVGLSAAAFLAWRGVKAITVERHSASAQHPRAIGYTPRTMELFQPLGLVEHIPQVPASFRLRRAKIESLAGKWREETEWTPARPDAPRPEYSPHPGAAIAQDRLEPLLREKARQLGADLRLGTELLDFAQDEAGVSARLRRREDGKEYTVRAQYMIAADGSKSAIREALGIPRKGRGYIRTIRSVLFRAPLDEYLASGISQFEIEQPDLRAFLTTYQDGRWVLMFTDDQERDDGALLGAIERALGRRDLDVAILATGRWELSGLVASQYASGRVFLAGDAAHTLPPTRGGFGANTGIDDVHNLAWKLQSVLAGKSDARLLDTYDEERRPIGWLRHQQTFARPDYASVSDGIASDEKILDDAAMELGQLYRSAAVLGAADHLPPAARPDEWRGQPGTRAPHHWLHWKGERISTLDLFQRTWVVVCGDETWQRAAAAAEKQLGLDVAVVPREGDIAPAERAALLDAFGIGPDGVSLVRPDGYIAWRAPAVTPDPERTLIDALAQVSFAQRSAG